MARMQKLAVCLCLTAALSACAQHPRDNQIHDLDTKAWWHTTEDLSGDSMEGRDTGSVAYQRAAEYVAGRFKAAGLKPAGDNNTYFQSVPMHEVAVASEGTSFVVERPGGNLDLQFLQEITVVPSEQLATSGAGPLTFRGYCGKDDLHDATQKIVVCFGTQRKGLPSGGERVTNAREAGAIGIIHVDDPYFSIEPPRWPYAYARSLELQQPSRADHANATPNTMLPSMRISAAAFAKLLQGSGQDAATILKAGGAQQTLASFDIPGTLRVHLHNVMRKLSSPNVIAIQPGSDHNLRNEYVVVAAHLDGYGFGTPVAGDNLYNGTLDDAAYVALLIQMADDFRAGNIPHPKRSVLFCAFTGEEKGLLGSNWFVDYPTVPKESLVADINLDQLRPLFPLRILTALAVNDTTLGQTAREVGKPMGIDIREDHEPERGLLRRADHYPFLRIGVPAIGFIFGYDPNTDAEKRYREWYQVRYHRPQDDLTQPVDFDAAAKFNQFFYKLVDAVGDAPNRPAFMKASPLAPKK